MTSPLPTPTIPTLNHAGEKALAQAIAKGAGGYRKGHEIEQLFRDIGFPKNLESRSRVPFAIDVVSELNKSGQLSLLLCHLCEPRQYPGMPDQHEEVRMELNAILKPYGQEIVMDASGLSAQLEAVTAGPPRATPLVKARIQPDFSKIGASSEMTANLEERWAEAENLHSLPTERFTIIALGALLEGALLLKAQNNKSTAYRSAYVPKDKKGVQKPISQWTLENLIDIAQDVGWIHPSRAKFSHVVRHYRNYIHPNLEVSEKVGVDKKACELTWIAVEAALEDLTK